jgi:mono/diheme cytochrome c family protein
MTLHPQARRPLWLVLWPLTSVLVGATEIDTSKLPAPATQVIDFSRDIQPILADNCLRCHGPERPKGGFRLTDRDVALKGGGSGVVILSGSSATSPLIHYVARLVPDMEMPPEGKGEPLSTNQVALLRAWIDQGVPWNTSGSATQTGPATAVSPWFGGTIVRGNQSKFRELEWRPGGWDGGLETFNLSQQWTDGRAVSTEGHLSRDDYKLTLDLRKPDVGFARFGFDQYRKYFADAGGYYDGFSPPLYDWGTDLHLDIGKVWLEFGLTLPRWPRLVLGYEHYYQDGMKSMLSWGPVASPTGNFLDTRSIYPAVAQIHEDTHVFRLEVSYDLQGFELQDQLRAEIHSRSTRRADALSVAAGAAGPNLFAILREKGHSTQIANTARVQKELYDWWLAGAGYRYSWYDGDSSLSLTPQDGAGQPASGNTWSANQILLNEVWQVANAMSQFHPYKHLTATFGVQGEWKRQETFGDANLDIVIDPTDPTSGVFRFPVTERSALNQATAQESLVLRYTGVPFTALFAEAKLKQEVYDRAANQEGGPRAFQLASDVDVRWQDYLVGFSSSPWRRISFGGHYRHRDRQTRYDYGLVPGNSVYPGFIQARGIIADEVEARVTLRPETWIATTLTYRWGDSDYRTTTGVTLPSQAGPNATPGGQILAGRYHTHTISANANLTPIRRLNLNGTISYQTSSTITADHGSLAVAPYRGELWSMWTSVTYALDPATDLFTSYYFSRSRYGQNNMVDGLPLGMDYDRHGVEVGLRRSFSSSVTARLQYAFFSYEERSSGHLLDFTAHQILATVNLRW